MKNMYICDAKKRRRPKLSMDFFLMARLNVNPCRKIPRTIAYSLPYRNTW